jgi:hypothetical protein
MSKADAFIKDNFRSLIIIVGLLVVFVMFSKGCFQKKENQPQPTVIIQRDTVYNYIQSTGPVQSQPLIITTQQPTVPQVQTIREIIYRNDTTVIRELLEKYYSKVHYTDVLKLDSHGTVKVIDTISQNGIEGRSFTYDLKQKVITNTVTIKEPYKSTNQLYYGFAVGANRKDLVNAFKAGIALRNKAGQIFILNGTIHKDAGIGAEIGFMKKF